MDCGEDITGRVAVMVVIELGAGSSGLWGGYYRESGGGRSLRLL